MPYLKERLLQTLDLIAAEPQSLDMEDWLKLPNGTIASVPYELCRYTATSSELEYVEPECGTTMCLAGHMAHAYIKGVLLDKTLEEITTITEYTATPLLALAWVGLCPSDEDYDDYCDKFYRVFHRYGIRTIRGLRIALKQEGLL